MRLAGKIVLALVVGIVLGLAATWITVFRASPGRISDGAWKTSLLVGSAQSDIYTRASVAVHGLLALDASEAVYYTANADSDGRRLDGACRYRVTGPVPDARWWSITAYGSDDYLIPNPAHRYSVSTAATDAARALNVQVGGAAGGDSWIPTRRGPFSLTLRLYNPGGRVLRDPARVALPRVTRVSCP